MNYNNITLGTIVNVSLGDTIYISLEKRYLLQLKNVFIQTIIPNIFI